MRLKIPQILIFVVFMISCVKDQSTPVAKFTVTPLKGDVEDSFYFDAGISYDNNDRLSRLQFRWDWDGDGLWEKHYSSEISLDHKFNNPGIYNVHLEVINTNGLSSLTSRQVEVMDAGPLYQPEIMFPSDNRCNVDITSLITWSCYHIENLDLSYDLYFGGDPNPPLIKKNWISETYDPGLLNSASKYYWKVVARDNNGNTSSGPIWSFSTLLFDERDNQNYQIINIANTEWMAENLNYKTDQGSWCFENKSSNCDLFGRLYDWETANNNCPPGWYLPTDSVWRILEREFLLTGVNYRGSEDEEWENELREGGSSGFNVLLAGTRDFRGRYSIPNTDGGFWTSTGDVANKIYKYFFYDPPYNYTSIRPKQDGLSVRCVKNNELE